MIYKQIFPNDELQKYIRSFWIMEGSVLDHSPKTFKIIADGCPGLIFQENPNSFSDNGKKILPQLFLHGLTTNHFEKTVKGDFINISIHFKPTALKSIFGIDANELTNSYTDINLLNNSSLTEQLINTTLTEKRIEVLSLFLIENLRRNQKYKPEKIQHALDLLKQENPITSLQKIQRELHLSERSLERLFKQDIGISPKLFARISRFQILQLKVRILLRN
jgi:AraC-like DNA-binding protein